MSLYGLAMSLFWHRKHFSCWPLPRLSVMVSSTLCRIVSLIPALPNARNNCNGRLLCPVRAVRRYFDRTAAHHPRCERLFVTAGRSKEEISKTTGSGRQYHVLTSSRVQNSLFLALELGRLMLLFRLFFSRRTSLSARC